MSDRQKAGKVIAFINNKGGVGKTTSAVSLAAGLAGQGERTLLLDIDAQGSASLSLGITRDKLKPSSAEVILEGLQIKEAVRPSSVGNLDILPGSMDLASADLILADIKGREAVLNAALSPILSDYRFIILDCPPSLGLLTVNALTAADYFIIPVTPDYLALEGLVNLTEAVKRIEKGIGRAPETLGILLTICDYRQRATEEIINLIRGHYGRLVFKTEIKINVRLKEAPSFGKTIFDYDAGSAGAECYTDLVKEVMARLKA